MNMEKHVDFWTRTDQAARVISGGRSYIFNPDKQYVKAIKKQVKANGGYCPSALEKNADTKCMCKEFREMDEGMCRCGLFIKMRNDAE